jgi:hypothetical protein
MKFRQVLLGALIGGVIASAAFAGSSQKPVLYLYGSVSEDGKVPAGDATPFHQMRLGDEGPLGLSQFRKALSAVGVNVEERYDASLTLTPEFLGKYDAIILGSNQRRFTPAEAGAVRKWVEAGGGLVAWSDSAFGGHYAKVGIANTLGRDSDNDLAAQFGMHFLTDNGGGVYRVREYTEPHYLNDFQRADGVRYRGEGVSPIRVSPPARMLAALQEGGLGGKLKVNSIDAPFDPQTDAALAIAEVGKGRVAATFDRNTFWNAGAGTRLSHDDNREFAQRLLLWVTHRETTQLDKPTAPASPTTPIKVDAGKDLKGKTGERLPLRGKVTGATTDVRWIVTEGDKTAVAFDNENAAATETGITLSKPGRFTLELRATAGEAVTTDPLEVIIE